MTQQLYYSMIIVVVLPTIHSIGTFDTTSSEELTKKASPYIQLVYDTSRVASTLAVEPALPTLKSHLPVAVAINHCSTPLQLVDKASTCSWLS